MKKKMRMNPILTKELMVGSRSIKMPFAIMGINVFLTLIVVLVIASTSSMGIVNGYNYSNLVYLFPILACIECGLLSLIIPIITSSAISGEREKQTLDIMLTTPVKPISIAMGKLESAMVVVMMYMISSVPVLSIAFVLGGMSWWALFGLIGMMIYLGIYVGSVGVFCSSVVKKSIVATVLTLVIGISIIIVTMVIFGIGVGAASYQATQSGTGNPDIGMVPLILLFNPYTPFIDFLVQTMTNSSLGDFFSEISHKSYVLKVIYKFWIPISVVINLVISYLFLKLSSKTICVTRNKKH